MDRMRDVCIAAGKTLVQRLRRPLQPWRPAPRPSSATLTRFFTYHEHHGDRREARRLYCRDARGCPQLVRRRPRSRAAGLPEQARLRQPAAQGRPASGLRLDGPEAKPSESIHLLFAGEKVRAEYPLPSPDLSTITDPAGYRVMTLEALVQMKLLSNRDKDRTHVRDLIGVGLVDRSWLGKLPLELAERLRGILDSPES